MSETNRAAFALLMASLGADLPQPERDYQIAGYVVDFAWPSARLVIDVSSGIRNNLEAFQAIKDKGWTTLRYNVRMLALSPERVIAEVRRVLEANDD